MRKQFFYITGFIFVSAVGTLLHFAYEWSGQNFLVGLFAAVSESTWEHMKLLFFPMLLWGFLGFKALKKICPQAMDAYAAGLLLGTLAIPVLFYTYSGILGFNLTWADIAIFYISAALAFGTAYKIAARCHAFKHPNVLRSSVIILLILFMLFTYAAPNIALFQQP